MITNTMLPAFATTGLAVGAFVTGIAIRHLIMFRRHVGEVMLTASIAKQVDRIVHRRASIFLTVLMLVFIAPLFGPDTYASDVLRIWWLLSFLMLVAAVMGFFWRMDIDATRRTAIKRMVDNGGTDVQ